MRDAFSVDEVFDNRASEELVDVIILPVGKHDTGTYTLPQGYTKESFEGITFVLTRVDQARFYEENTYDRAIIVAGGVIELRENLGSTDVGTMDVKFINSTQFTLNRGGNTITRLAYMAGRVKRYTTTNLTAIIQVNGGNPITVSRRYEIPASTLPSEMLNNDGTIKKGVELTALITVGGKLSEMPLRDVQLTGGGWSHYGVKAFNGGDIIEVITAGWGTNNQTLNVLVNDEVTSPWIAAGNITSAVCEVVAVLGGETYITQVAGGN